jgi:hypothetical protein
MVLGKSSRCIAEAMMGCNGLCRADGGAGFIKRESFPANDASSSEGTWVLDGPTTLDYLPPLETN